MADATDPWVRPLLALDTATDACSVAVGDGERVVSRFAVMPRRHAARVLPLIDEVLQEAGLVPADLGAVAWGHGPGAFTGVRIAAGVVQGIAWSRDLPVVGVSTLAALAQGAFRRHGARRVWSALDARMGEVYWGGYALEDGADVMVAAVPDCVSAPAQVPVTPDLVDAAGIGTGWEAHGQALAGRVGEAALMDGEALPDARDLLPLARHALRAGCWVAARDAAPVYLRDRVTG